MESNHAVGAGKNLCAYIDGELGSFAFAHCDSIIPGQYVQVQNDVNHIGWFHLAEVEVYGF